MFMFFYFTDVCTDTFALPYSVLLLDSENTTMCQNNMLVHKWPIKLIHLNSKSMTSLHKACWITELESWLDSVEFASSPVCGFSSGFLNNPRTCMFSLIRNSQHILITLNASKCGHIMAQRCVTCPGC